MKLPSAARNPISLIGITIATAMAWVFLALLAISFLGYRENPYIGLILFVAIPAASSCSCPLPITETCVATSRCYDA